MLLDGCFALYFFLGFFAVGFDIVDMLSSSKAKNCLMTGLFVQLIHAVGNAA